MIFREVEDRDLIAKARRGDVEAYNLLVSRWEKRIFNYLLRLVSNREDALDLSQETFLKAYQNLRKLDDPARFAAWLFRIAHNEAYSLLRRRKPDTELAGEPRPKVLRVPHWGPARLDPPAPVVGLAWRGAARTVKIGRAHV